MGKKEKKRKKASQHAHTQAQLISLAISFSLEICKQLNIAKSRAAN